MSQVIDKVLDAIRAEAKKEKRAAAKVLDVDAALLAMKELDHTTQLVHRLNGYAIALGQRRVLAADEAALKALLPLGVMIAPEVVTHLEIPDDASALVTRYRACERGQLKRADEVKGPFAAAAIDRFLADMKKVVGAGLTHAWATRGLAAFLVATDTQAIVLTQWGEALEKIAPEAAAQTLAKIERNVREKR
jgi:hypothetical protein